MASEAKFYIGLDVHPKMVQYAVRQWDGGIVEEGQTSCNYKDLHNVLEPYLFHTIVCMEPCVGFEHILDGFKHDNIDTRVANLHKIRQLVTKSDKLDARRLSDMLRLNSFPESYIPDKEVKDLRNLVSRRHSHLEEKNKLESRIWARVTQLGLYLPQKGMFGKKNMIVIKKYASDKDDLILKSLISERQHIINILEESTSTMAEYCSSHFPVEFKKLSSMIGIGDILSSYLISEIHPVERFANEKKLKRYAGLCPCGKESGGKSHGYVIPKYSCRKLLKWALVQAAHCAARKKDSKINRLYKHLLHEKKSKQTAKVACAAHICMDVFRTLKN